jgi:prepilin-type N-terminal cleavage/methylation domain-containing protein
MKIFRLKRSPQHDPSLGFTLVEVLMAISILGMTASLISYAVSQMITTNQKLAKEQDRRVELSRALDLIANDVKISTIDTTGRAVPKKADGVTDAISGTVVLDMDVVAGDALDGGTAATTCATATKNRIIYTIRASSSTEIGPNVLYRYGLISNSAGKIDCGGTLLDDGYAIADALSIDNTTRAITPPTCGSSAATGERGFYTCVKDNQVSLAVYIATQSIKTSSGYTNTKTYGINRNVISGATVATVSKTPELWCLVPNIVGQTNSAAATAIATVASTVDTTQTLRANAIRTEVSANDEIVTSQYPAPNTKLPCDGGMVTYTY